MNILYPKELNAIEQIIERSRREEERLLIDSKTAAFDILKYLHDNGNLTGKVLNMKHQVETKEAAAEFY